MNLPMNSDSAEQREILDALPVLVFLERAGKVVYANLGARELLGLADREWNPCPVEDVLWGLSPGMAEPQTQLTAGCDATPFHATLHCPDGQMLAVEGVCRTLDRDPCDAVIIACPKGAVQTPRLRLMEDVLSSVPEALVIVYSRRVLYTNPAFTRMFGFTAEEASEGDLWEMIVPENRRHEHALLEMRVDQEGLARIETVRMSKSGHMLDVGVLAGPLLVGCAKAGYVLSFRDIGERKQKEARLQHDALHDALTGLANRALFLDRVTVALNRRMRRRDQGCGVLFVDLDRFKEINDTLGHAAGDALLVAVSQRLRAALRPQDSPARLGGDEFGVLVENILNIGDLDIVARRVSAEMQRPFDILGRVIQTGASIGVALAGSDHTRPELLIRDADFAMYRAKEKGGGGYEIFDEHLEMHFTSQQDRERELRRVLDYRQFGFLYQPVYQLQSGKIEGFEALLHCRQEDGSVTSFDDLLSLAEDTGVSITLGRETLDAACRQLRQWTDENAERELTLTVNVTQRQFYHVSMIPQLKAALAGSGVEPSRLCFEVSETTLNENPEAATAILERMAECNVGIALDDFGSCLAPLNYLVRLPIHMLKLDPILTAKATSTGRQLAVLESLVHLGRNLGMQVVAQGIKTPAQLEALRRIGCELGQGDFLCGALEAAQAIRQATMASDVPPLDA